jgi:chemotaxis methyl-accepting protein methylase
VFDVVLCRYSAFLYLNAEEAQQALARIVDAMAPGGYLVYINTCMYIYIEREG